MKFKVVIVCGGTGGHLSPGIATAQRIQEMGGEVQLVVSEKEIDTRLASKYPDLNFSKSPGAAFGWRLTILSRFLVHNLRGMIHSFRFLKKERPDIVLAFGGFMSVGYSLSARWLRIPLVLHEANRKAGRSIRMLSGLAKLVYSPEGVTLPDLSPGKTKSMGMPLRREIRHIPKDQIRREMNIPRHVKVLVVVGGSQGAQALNDWASNCIPSLAAENIWPIIVSGPGKKVVGVKPKYKSDGGDDVSVGLIEFHDSMHELFSCADLVVSRAGAGTIAELICCLCPSVLVPYPHAADNHQYYNAQDLEKRGGAVLLPQTEINTLYREVIDLIFNDWMLGEMRRNLTLLNRGDAGDKLVKDLLLQANVKLDISSRINEVNA